MTMTTIIVTACLAGAALVGLAFLAVFRGGALAERREQQAEVPAVDHAECPEYGYCVARSWVNCPVVVEGYPPVDEPADLPTVEEWERQRAADHYPAPGANDPDDTQVLNRYGTRPANDDTVPGWAQTRPVEVPVVTSVGAQTVVLTEVVPGRHAAGHVQFVDPDWYNAQLGCAQYPRAVNLR